MDPILSYSTNLTELNKCELLWEHFSQVNIKIGDPKSYAYIRGSNLNKVEENIKI